MKENIFASGELWIQSGTFNPDEHSFVQILDAPPQAVRRANDLDSMNATDILQLINDDIFPMLDPFELTSAQIKNRLPLFSATLILLPGNYAVYSIKMSHCVGDGVTFFQLIKQVSLCMNGLKVAPIDWDVPLKATHEFYPPEFSPRDVDISYGLPFLIGALKNFLFTRRQGSIILLDKHKVRAKKKELREQLGCSDISSNDVITAALCQAVKSSDVFVFTENTRSIIQGVPVNAGGNFLWEIPVPREVCSSADELRRVVASSSSGYKTNELPLQPFLCGRVARVTSLASIAESLLYNGTEGFATVPSPSFMKGIPLDVALIFRFNKQYWGVLQNFAEFDATEGMIQDLL